MTESLSFRELEFLSLPENINLIEALVEELKTEFNLSEELEANILVSLSEAVNNAMMHGNHFNLQKKVKVKMTKSSTGFSFLVEDEGSGFNVDKVKDPTAPENLDKPTGRGIFLMRNLADKVEFSKDGRAVVIYFFQE